MTAKIQMTTSQALKLLQTNPAKMRESTADLTDSQAASKPSPDEWSVTEILAHLRCCADIWTEAIHIILAEDHPRIKAVNPRLVFRTSPYPGLPFHQSFAEFEAQREVLLTRLRTLAPADWVRAAEVYGAGAPLERTVAFYVQWLARHERSHLRELARVAEMARTQGISQD